MSVFKLQFDQPRDWQDFEDLCYLLWKRVWRDENAQKNGRQGQSQAGVDIFGRPGCGTRWAGVQCKGKDKYVQTALTKAELTSAVKDARKWRAGDAKLAKFVVATTGPRDERMQELAREITEKHRKRGLFSVTVCSWSEIPGEIPGT